MCRAGLLGVCAADNLGSYSSRVSFECPRGVFSIVSSQGARAYRIRWPVGRGSYSRQHGDTGDTGAGQDVRSLLAGEALEDDLGVAIDAQVVDGLRVRGAGRAVGATGDVAQRRRRHGVPGNGLHDVCEWKIGTLEGAAGEQRWTGEGEGRKGR